jgi:threonine synthase
LGVQKGFFELKEMGLIDRIPAMGNIQAEGCSPMVQAWRKGEEVAEPVKIPRTHIATLATGDPGRTYTLLCQRMKKSAGGVFESISDEETFHTMHILAKMEGISVEPAAAVAFAGLTKLVRGGQIKPDEVIVVNCTGHTMPIEHDILGDGWSNDVVYPSQAIAESPQEGLLAALSRITPDRYARIEIVDDLPDARRLIRRVLQSQGEYTLLEASSGAEALEIARNQLPDLIILDLMMPEMDGFSVLDALKSNPTTGNIPVIVVTAKELTPEEEKRLRGRIHALMQKGQFMSDELMEEVRSVLD